jgi:hypothetical protein
MPLMQLRQALSQAHDAWLELCFVDDAFGITIDEPKSGSAGTLGFGPHVATLKHKAEQLAMAQAERIQNGET